MSTSPSVPEVRIEMRSNPLYLSGTREMLAAVEDCPGPCGDELNVASLGSRHADVDRLVVHAVGHQHPRAGEGSIGGLLDGLER